MKHSQMAFLLGAGIFLWVISVVLWCAGMVGRVFAPRAVLTHVRRSRGVLGALRSVQLWSA